MNNRIDPHASTHQRFLLVLFASMAVTYVLLAIVGGFQSYCPVPFWDSWGGIIDFQLQIQDGTKPSWWAQHNEHRIIFSRLLFWIDWRFFGGTAKFLLVCNYLLLILGYGVLLLFLKAALPAPPQRFARGLIAALITCLTFSWIQKENLVWGFQSQFVLAQVFPLLGLYLLYRASEGGRAARYYFAGACVAGVFSMGGIISGILALPLMTILAARLQMGLMRVAILGSVTAIAITLYLHDYVSPAHHGSLSKALAEQPADLVRFLLLYLGGPLQSTVLNARELSYFAGGCVIFFCINHAERALQGGKREALRLTLLMFMLHIGGTAFGTAAGRVQFGLDAALWQRYMTPVLISWCVMLILAAPQIAEALKSKPWRTVLALALLPLLLAPAQLKAVARDPACHQHLIAALAMELQVDDAYQLRRVYPEPVQIAVIARKAAERDVSVFSDPRIKNVGSSFNQSVPAAESSCQGHLDATAHVGDARYLRLAGWLYSPQAQAAPESLSILDAERKTVGHAIGGGLRDDVAAALGSDTRYSGFTGYVLADAVRAPLVLSANGLGCELKIERPPVPKSTGD